MIQSLTTLTYRKVQVHISWLERKIFCHSSAAYDWKAEIFQLWVGPRRPSIDEVRGRQWAIAPQNFWKSPCIFWEFITLFTLAPKNFLLHQVEAPPRNISIPHPSQHLNPRSYQLTWKTKKKEIFFVLFYNLMYQTLSKKIFIYHNIHTCLNISVSLK